MERIPEPKLPPDPPSWAWIKNFPPPHVEPRGRWNNAGGWTYKVERK